MGYRLNDIRPPKPDSDHPIFDVTNNTIAIWSLPCFYIDVEKPVDWHDPKLHDHLGWPRPDMPDHVCQQPWEFIKSLSPDAKWRYIDMNRTKKIHFLSEYELDDAEWVEPSIVFDTVDEDGNAIDTSDIETYCWIREPEDWIIDLSFNPKLDGFAGKPKDYLFNAYISRYSSGLAPEDPNLISKDLLVRGRLLVFPG